MNAPGHDRRLHDLLLDRALGFADEACHDEIERSTSQASRDELESYDRAAAALHLAFFPLPLFRTPTAMLQRIEERAAIHFEQDA